MSDREPILTREAPGIILSFAIAAAVCLAFYWTVTTFERATLAIGKLALCWLVLSAVVWAFRWLRTR
jgi:hypothetical protein